MKVAEPLELRHTDRAMTRAVTPHAASTILTDTQGIIAGETTIPSQGEQLPAYLAKPASGDGPYPIILVVQEIFGVHQHIQDVCRRLAKQGYLAIAPELYFRQGDPHQYDDIPSLLSELVSKVPECAGVVGSRSRHQLGSATGGRCQQDRDYRLLLGRTNQLAVCSAQSTVESRRCLVRKILW